MINLLLIRTKVMPITLQDEVEDIFIVMLVQESFKFSLEVSPHISSSRVMDVHPRSSHQQKGRRWYGHAHDLEVALERNTQVRNSVWQEYQKKLHGEPTRGIYILYATNTMIWNEALFGIQHHLCFLV